MRRCCVLLILVLATLCFGLGQSKPKVVVIDPGHPTSGRDFGSKGKKLTEVQANFHIAMLLANQLRKQGLKVILTHDDVRLLVTTKRRAEIANWAHADLFIRLHCDATTGSGYQVVYPGAQGVAADGVKGPSQHVINASSAAAKLLHAAMAASIKGELTDGGILTDGQTPVGIKQGALTGSIYSECPTVLVNMVVLSNPKDEAWMLNYKNPPKLATALCKGVLAALGIQGD